MTTPAWPEVFPTLNQPDHENHLDWTFECGAQFCTWVTYHRTQAGAEAERERHHYNEVCPYTEIQRVINDEGRLVAAGESIIEKFWKELDRVTKEIMGQRARFKNDEMSEQELEGYHKLQGQAQGLAIAIQIISAPHFEDVRAVSMWSLKRYRMNAGEIEFMDTPGCGGYNPMPAPTREIKKDRLPAKKKTGPAADPKTGKFRALSDEDRKHLQGMVKSGLPDAAIQSMLKLSDEQYEHEKAKVSA